MACYIYSYISDFHNYSGQVSYNQGWSWFRINSHWLTVEYGSSSRIDSTASSLIVGSFLLGWGIASIMMKGKEGSVHQLIRICPRCGRNLSTLPQDIKRCPYCGNELA